MTPPHPPGQSRPARRARRAFLVLAVCAAAVAGAVALDWYAVEQKRRESAGAPGDPKMLAPPQVLDWRAYLIAPDTPAPDFSLVDVRTGMRVDLDDFHGRPVVVLMSSYG